MRCESEGGTSGLPGALTKAWHFHSAHASGASTARHELTEFLHDLAPQDELFQVELIMGELLANAFEHAPGPVEVHIDWTGERPVLRVRDSGPGFQARESTLPEDPFDENGRGLFLVRTFAERLDIRPAPGRGTEFVVILPLLR